jgi:peptide-methionine (S)-S-oxide reductase
MLFSRRKAELVSADNALPGRASPIATAENHFVNGHPLKGPYPAGTQSIVFALGCYWGAERKFWTVPGVWVTAAGNAGGYSPNPTYEEVCSGATGHAEAVLVVFDPKQVSLDQLLKIFFESHDPTQGMRQGNDVGTQYRSGIYWSDAAHEATIRAATARYGEALKAAGMGPITTELAKLDEFYFAEAYHQQYLAKNPQGYCGLGGTGVTCPIGVGVAA